MVSMITFFFFVCVQIGIVILEYETCIRNAQEIDPFEKSLFCPNFYYVFYGELEMNLNRYFIENSRKEWSLLFVDYNFMPSMPINRHKGYHAFYSQPHLLTILHNAKIKYRCLDCHYEWTTARGRVKFQAEIPEENKYNVLFAYLFTQKCQICHREIEPSWYLDEVTRVMKNVCRILMEYFYSSRPVSSSPTPSSSSIDLEFEEERSDQRASDMQNHHYKHLCQACLEGSCYTSSSSPWQYQ